jgi:hypothetical protein
MLHEERIAALTIPLADWLDPYGNGIVLGSTKIARLRSDLLAGRHAVSGWEQDYVDALIQLCDEATATEHQVYYDGP